jgi:G3E family GTPase
MRLLEYWKIQGRRVGVLMNEAGVVSIDGPRAGTIAEQVLNLAGGCVCCDTKEDLSWGIAQLVRDYESEIVVLECSGMADPVEVVDAVTDLYTARLAQLERVIALLQPLPTEQNSSSAYVTTQAIRCADEIILNKRDLYITGHWDQFKASVASENPHARFWEASHAKVDPNLLLAPIAATKLQAKSNVVFGAPRSSRPHIGNAYHPIATTVHVPGPLNRERFLAWMKQLPKDLDRAKGFFRFQNEPALQEFQYAPPGRAMITPVMLLDEPKPAIVLIGRGYDQEQLRKALLSCMIDPN